MSQSPPRAAFPVQVFEIAKLAWLRRSGTDIPLRPYFASDALTEMFLAEVDKASAVLEFGAGGSTLFYAQAGKRFVSVETDPIFLAAVKAQIERRGWYDENRQTFIHRDIGPVRMWGRPVFFRAVPEPRLAQFRECSDFPVDPETLGKRPLVLVDGRFRVATALKAIKALNDRGDWTIWFDDFTKRKTYRDLLKVCTPEILHERIARITPDTLGDLSGIDDLIRANELDWY